MDARTRDVLAAVLLTATALTTAACTTAAPTAGSAASPPATATLPIGDDPVTLDPADFTTEIDNPYWPMVLGTRWTYRETDATGDALRVVVIVTSDTKTVANGVTARVVRDTVYRADQIVEDTFDWYAQDADGNIWYLGEDTAEFDNGAITSRSGSFEAGVDGALPGILMAADPQPGMQYRQEYYAGEAEDQGEVLSVNAMADAAAGHFTDALLTWDTTPIQPDVAELKFYAAGVGPVLVLSAAGGSAGREELVSIDTVPNGTGTGPLGQPE